MEEINIIPLPVEKLNLEDSDLPDGSFRSLLEEEEEAIETMTVPSSCISPMQMIQTVEKEKRAEAIKTIIPVLAREISISMEHLKDSGMLEMKWEIQTPDLQEIEIYVRHFDTAPDTFHIEIAAFGNMQALLQKNLPLLEKMIASRVKTMDCRFSPISVGSHKKRKKVVQSTSVVYSAN